jgi:hypothetical protein
MMEAPVILRRVRPVVKRRHDSEAGGKGEPVGAKGRIVMDVSDLQKLVSLSIIMLASVSVNLQIEGMRTEDILRWQTKINRQLMACGCKEGGLFMAVTLVGYIGYLSLYPANLAAWEECTIGLGIAVATGAVGKLLGLLRAREHLRRTVDEVRTAVESSVNVHGG